MVSGATALLAAGGGLLVALRMATAPRAWRKVLQAGALLTLALPPFLVMNHWLELLAGGGSWRRWLPLEIHSRGGVVVVLSLMFWPMSALMALAALDRIEAPLLESEPLLRGRALLRWLLWPAVRKSVGLAALLTFVISFSQFSIPVILQVPVYPEELWLALTTRLNESGAWAAAIPLVLIPFFLLFLIRHQELEWPRGSGYATSHLLARQLGKGWCGLGTIVSVLLFATGLALPLGRLLFALPTWNELPTLLRAAPDVVMNSFLFAFMPATLGIVVGGLTWRHLRGGSWLLWLLFFVPGVLLGRSMIFALGRTVIYGTSAVVVIALLLRYLAVSRQGFVIAGSAMDSTLLEVGRMEGARGWDLFRFFALPQLIRPIAVTWYVLYLLALWDVETLVLIYPPGGETLALRIFNALHYGHNAQVNAMCIALLGLAIMPGLLWQMSRWGFLLRSRLCTTR
jgi:iron(III) transport system permease protein